MSIVSRIINYARLDLQEIYADTGVISQPEFDEALDAAKEHTERRLNLEVSAADLAEASMVLEGQFNVYVGDDHVLVNNENHVEWFDRVRSTTNWDYWERYRQWLIEDEHRSPTVIDSSLHPITDRILGLLEDPARPGKWSRRGLVAGQVQSGKTSNYVGLINKALDAGYKLIVVMAGTHDNLRSQTQIRINSGVLGFDTQGNVSGTHGKRVGVGLKSGQKPRINCPTDSGPKGDFSRHLAKAVGSLGSDPVILVVKKNTSILKNLHAWATGLHHEVDPMTGRRIVNNVPLLLIDDEADYASIDTGSIKDKETDAETDPSATNRLIRQFLATFEKSAYIGYTATPFANIFINPAADHEEYGPDLFPEHFIVALPETSSYSGAALTFGLKLDDTAGVEAVEPLPTTREIDDYGTWLPDGHKKIHMPKGDLPPSLQSAIHSFVLASAIKRHRGVPMRHNSMLVHVTRFIDVQAAVAEQISEYTDKMRQDVQYFDPENADAITWSSLRELYETDFASVHASMSGRSELAPQMGLYSDFESLHNSIKAVLIELGVKQINGESGDALQYEERPAGVTVIAVGGDKLSRGLTLEGLTTSYYLRASKMYDTLLQMGRWFGYRPGYLDTCRLYTTSQLVTWYMRITSASERLYKDFELMAAMGRTPKDFGLRVQRHPDGLMVTAANKSRHAKNVRVSFSGAVSETILFVKNEQTRLHNLERLRELVESISGNPDAQRLHEEELYWRNVPASAALTFVDGYKAHSGAVRALPQAMAEYIRECMRLDEPELTHWDVFVANKAGAEETLPLAGERDLGLITRNPGDGAKQTDAFVIPRLVSSGDELLPLRGDDEAKDRALAQTIKNWENSSRVGKRDLPPTGPSAVAERGVRSRKRGFLMIYPLSRQSTELNPPDSPYVGMAVSFPWSDNAPAVDYRVNEIYWDLQMEQALAEQEEELSHG